MVGTYGLPLVMVKGRFANVADMTVKNLEAFIPFMMKCSIHKEGCPNERPIWWPTVLPFRHTLQKPSSLTLAAYRQKLLAIVYSCYQCHGLQYLLKLSSDLSNLSNLSCQKVSNGVEETTFIIPSFTDGCGRLLTLNNENLTYDSEVVEIKMEPKSPRRCLMPSNTRHEVYLCEYCDDEYYTRSAMTAHELQCYQTYKSKLRDPLELDEPVCQEPEQPKPPETTPQDLLGYLQLKSSSLPPLQSIKPSRVRTRLKMNKNVEFSSLLGRQILSCTTVKRDLVSKPEKLVQAYEAYCYVSARGTKSREYEFRNYYKRTAANNVPAFRTVQYCFSRAERYQRYLTLKTGLDQNSRKLLSQMKRCSVKLRRWVPPPTPLPAAPPLINLADDDDEMSSATTSAAAAATAQADAVSSSTTKRDAVTLDSEKTTLYNLLSEQSDQAKTLIGLRLLLKKGANGWDLNPARKKDPTTVAHSVIHEIDLISDEE